MATAEDDGYDSDGCRFSCEPTEERRALERARRAWSSADDGTRAFWAKTRATWSQTTQCVEIAVSMPVDTRAEDISVDIQTTRLVVRVRWHGEVRALTGPLRRRCRADESVWTLSSSAREFELLISLAKDDAGADAPPWSGVIEGGSCSKSPTEALSDMVRADEPYPDADELCVETHKGKSARPPTSHAHASSRSRARVHHVRHRPRSRSRLPRRVRRRR